MKRGHDTQLLSDNLGRLFWDIDLSEVSLNNYPEWVVERVLEFGNFDDVQLLVRYFGKAAFLDLVSGARFASRRTMSFWEAVLEQEGCACTRKFSREIVWTC